MRKTKIICTLGPSCTDEVLSLLVSGGMDAARFNFSHGDCGSHGQMLRRFRSACRFAGVRIPAILDTRGPEVRVCGIREAGLPLLPRQRVRLLPCSECRSGGDIGVTCGLLAEKAAAGDTILMDDGLIELRALCSEGRSLLCEVVTGGTLHNNKSINLPGRDLQLPFLNDRDRADLSFGVEQQFDCIAASFVKGASDIGEMRRYLRELGADLPIIAKIENREGVDQLEHIISAADGVMVARGDLGVEIPSAQVPAIQKRITACSIGLGKPVIIATQMLDSMCRHPRPTRAEVSDVAQAVFDMADCVMLSGETASGLYPQKSLAVMSEILMEAERSMDLWSRAPEHTVMSKNRICQLYNRPRKVYNFME